MSKALKCDRCGEFYESNSKPKYTVTDMRWNTQLVPLTQDLCPRCYKSFELWWCEPTYCDEKLCVEEE